MYVVFPFCWRFLPPHGCICKGLAFVFIYVVFLLYKYKCDFSKIKKNVRTQSFKKYKRQKRTHPKSKNAKPKNIQNQNKNEPNEPTPCSFWKARTNLQNKCKANLSYFLNPAIQILYIYIFELYFFLVFLILYRRPFCSQRRLLNNIDLTLSSTARPCI